MKKERIDGLDIFRGMALVSMIFYHFTYDLNYFHVISVNMNHSINFLIIRYTIITMFLLSVGMGLALAHKNTIKWKSIRKRILQLGLSSLSVSIATSILFPDSWIYFGILHLILLASLITLPLLKFPKITMLLSIVILVGSIIGLLHTHELYAFLKTPLGLPLHTQDLIPIFPWLAVVLIGTLIVHYNFVQKIFNHKLFNSTSNIYKILKVMGQHSLLIYLTHQIILFGAFTLYFKLVYLFNN